MHVAIIMGTVQSLWTWLWGRCHVSQNIFLVGLQCEMNGLLIIEADRFEVYQLKPVDL